MKSQSTKASQHDSRFFRGAWIDQQKLYMQAHDKEKEAAKKIGALPPAERAESNLGANWKPDPGVHVGQKRPAPDALSGLTYLNELKYAGPPGNKRQKTDHACGWLAAATQPSSNLGIMFGANQ